MCSHLISKVLYGCPLLLDFLYVYYIQYTQYYMAQYLHVEKYSLYFEYYRPQAFLR